MNINFGKFLLVSSNDFACLKCDDETVGECGCCGDSGEDAGEFGDVGFERLCILRLYMD